MPTSPWSLLHFSESKGPVPCEEAEPCRECTEEWVRTSAAYPYPGHFEGDIPTAVSLAPTSPRSLPNHSSARPGPTKPLHRVSPRGDQHEEAATSSLWYPSAMLQKVCAALPLPGSSSGSSTTAESRQSAAGDFNGTGTPFILPSTLCKVQSPPMGTSFGWRDSVDSAVSRAVRPVKMECGLGMYYDTDSDNDPEDSWVPLPRRELSANALSRLEASLRHALDNANSMSGNVPPTANMPPTGGCERGDSIGSRPDRPSFTYP